MVLLERASAAAARERVVDVHVQGLRRSRAHELDFLRGRVRLAALVCCYGDEIRVLLTMATVSAVVDIGFFLEVRTKLLLSNLIETLVQVRQVEFFIRRDRIQQSLLLLAALCFDHFGDFLHRVDASNQFHVRLLQVKHHQPTFALLKLFFRLLGRRIGLRLRLLDLRCHVFCLW